MAKMHEFPISIQNANAVVSQWHRHARPVLSARFAIGAVVDGELVGVAITGRPVSRHLDDGVTAEVNRVCVLPEAPKGTNSFLYACCWRAWREMGGLKMVPYTLQTESGASLRGAGWEITAETKPSQGWARPSMSHLNRVENPIYAQPKFRWERNAPKRITMSKPQRGKGR